MTSEQRHPGCLDANTMAEYIDGTLDPRQRTEVETHLAECEDCYEVLEDGLRAAVPARQMPSATRPVRSRWLWVAAAVLVLGTTWGGAAWIKRLNDPTTLVTNLATAVGPVRLVEGRLTGGFAWGQVQVNRGTADGAVSDKARESALVLKRRLGGRERARDWEAKALASMTLGRLDEALQEMRRAATLEPANASIQANLAALLLEYGKTSDAAFVTAQALSAAELARLSDPTSKEALFNRALAKERLGPPSAARQAWQDYLDLDPQSPWADEARTRLARLRDSPSARTPALSDILDMKDADLRRAIQLSPEHFNSLVEDLTINFTDSEAARIGFSRLSQALKDADVDQLPAEVAFLVAETPDARVRACVVAGMKALRDARRMYTDGQFVPAGTTLQLVERQFSCAGAPQAEVQYIEAAIQYTTRGTLPGNLATLNAEWIKRRYYRLAAMGTLLAASAELQHLRISASAELLDQALAMATKAGDAGLIAKTSADLGTLFDDQGDHGRAWTYFSDAMAMIDRVRNPLRIYQVMSAAIIAADQQGMPGAVIAIADDMLERTAGWTDQTATSFGLLRKAHALIGIDEHLALQSLAQARRAIAQSVDADLRAGAEAEAALVEGALLLATDPARSVEALTAGMKFLEGQDNSYRTAMLLLQRGRAWRALGNSERATQDWSSGVRLVADSRSGIRDEMLGVSRLDEVWGLFDELIDAQRSDAVAALETLELGRGREFLGGRSSAVANREQIAALQTRLPPGAAVVAFAVLPERTLVWTITRKAGVILREARIGRIDLAKRVAEIVEMKGDSPPHLESLSKLLLPQDLLLDPNQPVFIAPDGPLSQLPFAALPIAGRPLVQQAIPVFVPSLTALLGDYDTPAVTGPAVLIGESGAQPREGFPALPNVEREIAAVQTIYGSESRVYLNSRTPKVQLMAAMSSAGLIHFAGHGVSDLKDPRMSRLLLSGGEVLTGNDLADLHLRAGAIVVLSACETALGKAFLGTGSLSLSRFFLRAGARGVVAALWRVPDADSAHILSALHHELKGGASPAVALALVQRAQSLGTLGARWQGFTYLASSQ